MFEKVTTVAVYVTDLVRAKRFYVETLGFEVSADLGPELCFLRSKSGQINVYLEAGAKPTSVDNRTARLGFFLRAETSAQDAFNRLKAAGVRLLQDAPESVAEDTACFQFLDPDGNVIDVEGKIPGAGNCLHG